MSSTKSIARKWFYVSIGVLSIFILAAILAPMIAPDGTKNANQMHLSLPYKPSGFSVLLLKIPYSIPTKEQSFSLMGKVSVNEEIPIIDYQKSGDSISYQIYPSGETSKIKLAALGHAPIEERTFWLGTDQYGRDNLSRIILGSRISISVGLVAVLISLTIGILIGMLAGYYGGWVDRLLMWLINVIWTIPTLLLVLAMSLTLGKGFWQVFIAIGLTMWVEVARVIRGQVLSVKEKEYVKAAKVLGYSDIRIMMKHILPNVVKPLTTISASNFASAILIESGLSFLGIGIQPPTPSWGSMTKDLYHNIILGKYLSSLAPGMMIALIIVALMMIANYYQNKF